MVQLLKPMCLSILSGLLIMTLCCLCCNESQLVLHKLVHNSQWISAKVGYKAFNRMNIPNAAIPVQLAHLLMIVGDVAINPGPIKLYLVK